ncbi:hypothetical protein TKK_0002379 [Trichogramma kaykai]
MSSGIRKNKNLNYTDEDGYSHFHAACQFDGYDAVKSFLELGQDPNCPVKKTGDSPLHLALNTVNLEVKDVVEFLLTRGAIYFLNLANEEGLSPMQIIFKKPFDSECHLMQVFGRVSAKESRDFDLDLLRLLFEISDEMNKPVRVNARDKFGQTPLQRAVVNSLTHAFDALLNLGANLSSFVLPTESDFDKRFKPKDNLSFEIELKLRLASGALAIAERLEKEGHKLDKSNAMTIMKLLTD